MISKCQMSEFIKNLNLESEYASYNPNDSYWLGRLVWSDDVLWGLVCADAMTIKTFREIRAPITKFEDRYGCKILSRYNLPTQ